MISTTPYDLATINHQRRTEFANTVGWMIDEQSRATPPRQRVAALRRQLARVAQSLAPVGIPQRSMDAR